MPAYRASRCDLKTCTLLRAMIDRRTRRISSSLLPLNITPAITSTHPPAWWNGPLGPLTSDRDLYAVVPRGLVDRTIPVGAEVARHAGRRFADDRFADDRFAVCRSAACRFPRFARGVPLGPRRALDPLCRARRERRRDVP